MKEFMLFIRANGNPIHDLPFLEQQNHIKKVGQFIESLAEKDMLIGAQPLVMSGSVVSNNKGELKDEELVVEGEMIVGYYHIYAEDATAALAVAYKDPRFEDSQWRVEVREIMTIERINS